MHRLFLPGWGAHPGVYRPAIPDGWEILDPPSFAATGGSLAASRDWTVAQCRALAGPIVLGGHSFGAALAVHAALADGAAVERLLLVNPALLPLTKPLPAMLFDFSRRVAAGWFPPGEAWSSIRQVAFHPVAAHRLGTAIRRSDLSGELTRLRDRALPTVVVATSTDTLTTPAQCRRAAEIAGAEYREVDAEGGHLWFLRRPDLLAAELSA